MLFGGSAYSFAQHKQNAYNIKMLASNSARINLMNLAACKAGQKSPKMIVNLGHVYKSSWQNLMATKVHKNKGMRLWQMNCMLRVIHCTSFWFIC